MSKYYEVPVEVGDLPAVSDIEVQKEIVRQLVAQNILLDHLVQAVEGLKSE